MHASHCAGFLGFRVFPNVFFGSHELQYAMDRRLARQVPGSTAQARDAVEAARHPKRGAAGGAGPSAPPLKRPERQEPPERRETSSS